MWVAFANAKATHIFSTKILAYMPYLMVKVLMMLTNDILHFEQLGPVFEKNTSQVRRCLQTYDAQCQKNVPLDMCVQQRFRLWSESSLGAFWTAKDAKVPICGQRKLIGLCLQIRPYTFLHCSSCFSAKKKKKKKKKYNQRLTARAVLM